MLVALRPCATYASVSHDLPPSLEMRCTIEFGLGASAADFGRKSHAARIQPLGACAMAGMR